MSKLMEIIKEKSTWAIGVPSIVVGAMTLLDADHSVSVGETIAGAGSIFTASGDWMQALGFLGMGLMGIFMRGR